MEETEIKKIETKHDIAVRLCGMEGKQRQVDVANMSEIVSDLGELLRAEPHVMDILISLPKAGEVGGGVETGASPHS